MRLLRAEHGARTRTRARAHARTRTRTRVIGAMIGQLTRAIGIMIGPLPPHMQLALVAFVAPLGIREALRRPRVGTVLNLAMISMFLQTSVA